MKLGLKHISIVFLLGCLSLTGLGQNSPKAKKAYDKANKLAEKGKYDNVLNLYTEAILAEKKLGDKQDYAFVGNVLNIYARYFIYEEYYGAASQYFFLSAINYQLGGLTDKAQSAIQQVAYFEDSARKYQSQYSLAAFNTEREYTRYPISEVTKTSGDTTWFTMNIGIRDSIREGQTGWFVSIYDASKPERYVEALGKTTVVSREFGNSLWYMVMSEDGKESGFTPQIGDLNYMEVATNPDALDGILVKLSEFHILLESDYNQPLYTFPIGQLITKQQSEDAVIEMMRDIIRNTAESLYDPKTSTHTEKMTSGAFMGLNMWEAMMITRTTDVKAFLRYVIEYPRKYMGRKFRIDETYATWLTFDTPLADADSMLVDTMYTNVKSQEDWLEWKQDYGRYLSLASFDFSKVRSDLYTVVAEQKYDSALMLIDRWSALTNKHDYRQEYRDFEMVRAWVFQKQNQNDEAEALYLKLLEEVPKDYNIRWQLGLLYLTNENLLKALPEFEFVKDALPESSSGHGMYGWTLIKLGRFKKAVEHTKQAYLLDSLSPTYIMNHGHSLLLSRNYQDARKLYLKALENANSRSDFDEGIMSDFDIFIENGWEVDQVQIEKTHLTNQWNKHYIYKTIGLEFFTKGQGLEKNEQYLDAAISFDSAIAYEQRGSYVRYGLLRNYHRWSAYNYYKHKDYETSLARYMTSWEINLKHINDPELEVDDLETISNVNDWLDNDVMEDMFDKMKFAAQRKLQSQQRSNDLYLISIGTNRGHKNGYKHATSDAKQLAGILGGRAQRIFDASYLYVLTEDKKDAISDAFKQVIINSKPGDCFVLYYTGYTSKDQLIVGQDTIDNEQIIGWLSSMSASKKLILLDAVNSSLIDQYAIAQRDNKRDFLAESIGFLISDGRVELPNTTVSLFTSYLTGAIEGNAATNWQNDFHKDTANELAYVTSKSLEGYMYGNMSSGNLQFDLKSYSSGVDFPLTYVNAVSYTVDTIPPMIYIPNVVNSDGKRGGKTKIVTISKNLGGQALDESGILDITVNGISVAVSQNGKFTLDQDFTKVWTKLVIVARDRKGNVSTDSFIVNKSSEKLADPTKLNTSQSNYALLFATSNYDEWSDLKNPLEDVQRIGKLLKESYGFKVEILIDQTIEQMDSVIDHYTDKKQYAPNDQLFVFFAGHGHYVPGKGGFIVAKNSPLNGSTRNYLEFNDIQRYFNDIYSCKHIMLVFDVCFGGTAFDKTDVINYSESDLKLVRDSTDKFIKMKSKYLSRLFITSGSLEYVPDESQFALRFTETLNTKGAKKGGILTFDDFVDNLQTLSMVPDEKMPTTPRYGGFGNHDPKGEFFFKYIPIKKKTGFDPTNTTMQ